MSKRGLSRRSRGCGARKARRVPGGRGGPATTLDTSPTAKDAVVEVDAGGSVEWSEAGILDAFVREASLSEENALVAPAGTEAQLRDSIIKTARSRARQYRLMATIPLLESGSLIWQDTTQGAHRILGYELGVTRCGWLKSTTTDATFQVVIG